MILCRMAEAIRNTPHFVALQARMEGGRACMRAGLAGAAPHHAPPRLHAALILMPCSGWAYRPFESTDADVTGPGQIEMELGIFGWAGSGGDDTFITPQLVINYGLTQTLELIGEFEVIHPPAGGSQIAEPGLFLKSVRVRILA